MSVGLSTCFWSGAANWLVHSCRWDGRPVVPIVPIYVDNASVAVFGTAVCRRCSGGAFHRYFRRWSRRIPFDEIATVHGYQIFPPQWPNRN